MIKVFTTNKNGKIELTKDELKSLLDEAYWEGYKSNSNIYTYHSPTWSPYSCSVTTASNSTALDFNSIQTGATNATDTIEIKSSL